MSEASDSQYLTGLVKTVSIKHCKSHTLLHHMVLGGTALLRAVPSNLCLSCCDLVTERSYSSHGPGQDGLVLAPLLSNSVTWSKFLDFLPKGLEMNYEAPSMR